mmetsp:Transcript_20680/g.26099  ORF Transcript_20680/g.26099 Transcript_20680/m.26099 type:complete len:155 (-) Transcript_20680:73-537(-)
MKTRTKHGLNSLMQSMTMTKKNNNDNDTDMASISIASMTSSSLSTVEHYMQLEKRRSIRFHPSMVTEIRTRPQTLNEEKAQLFFSGHELQKIRDEEKERKVNGNTEILSKVVLFSSLDVELDEESDSDSDSDSGSDSDSDSDGDYDDEDLIGVY